MAKWFKPSEEQLQGWEEWIKFRPPQIQELCKRFPFDTLFKLRSSGHRVTIHSYNENSTMTVNVTGQFNQVAFERHVFGIKPDDLEECDLPGPNELVGTALIDLKDVDTFIDAVRSIIARGKNPQDQEQ